MFLLEASETSEKSERLSIQYNKINVSCYSKRQAGLLPQIICVPQTQIFFSHYLERLQKHISFVPLPITKGLEQENANVLANAIFVCNKAFCVCYRMLTSASIYEHSSLLACSQGKISDSSQFWTVLSTKMRCWQRHDFLEKEK